MKIKDDKKQTQVHIFAISTKIYISESNNLKDDKDDKDDKNNNFYVRFYFHSSFISYYQMVYIDR